MVKRLKERIGNLKSNWKELKNDLEELVREDIIKDCKTNGGELPRIKIKFPRIITFVYNEKYSW